MSERQRSAVTTILESLPVFGPPRLRMLSLLGLQVCATLAEGFGLGMMLPVAELMQANGQLDPAVLQGGHWKYLQQAADYAGVQLSISTLMGASLALFLLRNILLYVRAVLFASSVQSYIRDTRTRLFETFLHTKTSFQDLIPVGRLINDLQVQTPVSAGAVHSFIVVVHIGFMLTYYFIFLMILSWQLTLLSLLIGIAAGLVVRPILGRSRLVGEKLLQANQSSSSFMAERLNAARLIRLSRTESKETREFLSRAARQAEGEVQLVRNSSRTSAIIETVVMICGFMLLYIGGRILGLDLPSIGLALIIMLRQVPVLREFIITRHSIVSNTPSLAYLLGFYRDMQCAAEIDDGVRIINDIGTGIHFSNVTFRYTETSDLVLRGINLSIPARKMTAFVGPSGGGKSTLIDLLPRLREAESGQILIDGNPIADISRKSLRKNIAYTPQAPQIFNISAREHIQLGKADATDSEVREAARISGADKFIETWPDGYDTLLGEGGGRLSGGQKQRIDLARALVSGAPLLILDEPTSNLDVETEQEFQSMLKSVHEKTPRTVVVVGHRLSTVREADNIIVIGEGQVLESGTHAELMTLDGWYAAATRISDGQVSKATLTA